MSRSGPRSPRRSYGDIFPSTQTRKQICCREFTSLFKFEDSKYIELQENLRQSNHKLAILTNSDALSDSRTEDESVLADEGSDMLTAKRPLQKFGLQPVDDLKLFQLSGVSEQIDHDPVER